MNVDVDVNVNVNVNVNGLIRSPLLEGHPKSQEYSRFRLRFTMRNGATGNGASRIWIAADAQYVLWVNGSLIGQGPHRNFPDTLMADEYDLQSLLSEGDNVIAILVRHLYLDTFGYLRGEPAFGCWGSAGGTELSTGQAEWECQAENRYDEYAPRVNMHLGPLDDQNGEEDESWVLGEDRGGTWTIPVPCASPGRTVTPCPVGPLSRYTRDLARNVGVAGTFAALPEIGGTLYAFSPAVEVKNKAIAVRIRGGDRLAVDDLPIHIGFRGLGACLIRDNGAIEPNHNYGHHIAEGMLVLSRQDIEAGVLLYLLDAEYLILENRAGTPNIEVLGFHPLTDSFLRFDAFAAEPPGLEQLFSFPSAVSLLPVKETRLFAWSLKSDMHEVDQGAGGIEKEGLMLSSEGIVLQLDRFYFGHLELAFESDGSSERVVEIGYGYDTDAEDQPYVYNWDRFKWKQTSAVFSNRCTPRGFRYLFLSAKGNVLLKGISVTEALASEPSALHLGTAESSDPLWNRIWATARETLRYSRTDVISSDSFREFCAWLGDTQHIALNYYYTYFDPAFIRNTWDLYARNTDDEGRMFSVVPGYMKFHLPVWTWQFWIGVRNHYRYTGDRSFLNSVWPVCLQTYEFFERFKTPEGLLRDPEGWAIVDWARIDFTGESFVLNGLYRRAVLALAEMSEALGAPEAAARLAVSAERVKAALSSPRFFDPGKRLFYDGIRGGVPVSTYSQHAQLLAFSMGLWDEETMGRIWEHVNKPEMEMWTIGESSFHWAADILQESKDFGSFFEHVLQSYKWRVELGVSCFGHTHPGNRPGHYQNKQKSPAHGWSSSPAYLTGAYLLGVQPLQAGYEEVLIAPRAALARVTAIEGQVPTPRGPIRIGWALSADKEGTAAGSVPDGMSGFLDLSGLGKVICLKGELKGLDELRPGFYRLREREFELKWELVDYFE